MISLELLKKHLLTIIYALSSLFQMWKAKNGCSHLIVLYYTILAKPAVFFRDATWLQMWSTSVQSPRTRSAKNTSAWHPTPSSSGTTPIATPSTKSPTPTALPSPPTYGSWRIRRIPFTTEWSIQRLAAPYSKETQKCRLCLTEKALISLADSAASLNKVNKIVGKCRHRDKFLLKPPYPALIYLHLYCYCDRPAPLYEPPWFPRQTQFNVQGMKRIVVVYM